MKKLTASLLLVSLALSAQSCAFSNMVSGIRRDVTIGRLAHQVAVLESVLSSSAQEPVRGLMAGEGARIECALPIRNSKGEKVEFEKPIVVAVPDIGAWDWMSVSFYDEAPSVEFIDIPIVAKVVRRWEIFAESDSAQCDAMADGPYRVLVAAKYGDGFGSKVIRALGYGEVADGVWSWTEPVRSISRKEAAEIFPVGMGG